MTRDDVRARTIQVGSLPASSSPNLAPLISLSLVSPPKGFFGQPESAGWPADNRRRAELDEGLAATFFDKGLQKLLPLYDTHLNLHGEYVEK
jgi:hypothetical protein